MTAPTICLIGRRGWVDLLTTSRLTVYLARAHSRGQGAGGFKIHLHLSYRGSSGSDGAGPCTRKNTGVSSVCC